MTSERSLDQRRAAHALAKVREVNEDHAGVASKYRSYVDRLGPTILMNGLGQALATERAAAGSKSNDPHGLLYSAVQDWLCRGEQAIYPDTSDLLTAIVEGDEHAYLRAQSEALAWMEWHKKFSRAELPDPEGRDDE